MSVSIKTIEFERPSARTAELGELEGPPFIVNGVALGSNDITVGMSGVKKLWPEEELKKAASSLVGRNLVEDHDNSSRGVVGIVTKAGFKEGVGIIYEAELDDEDLAQKIANGRLEVSIRGFHTDVDEMEEDEETGAKIVTGIEFDNLSIVPNGASPSNSIEIGEAAELSVAQLSEYVGELPVAEQLEIGDTVQFDDMHGVVVDIDDDSVEVDLYSESDDVFRAVGETQTVSVESLKVWDMDLDELQPISVEEDEELERSEGAEVEITSSAERKKARENSPERYTPEEVEELMEYNMHSPDWSGKSEGDWSAPDMEDFDTDDLSEIGKHFLISSSGFPPENFGDLKLPVVTPSGDLSLSALRAVKGGRGVSAVEGLNDDMESRIVSWVNKTAKKEFDVDWSDAEETSEDESSDVEETNALDGVLVLTGDDLWAANKTKESEMDSTNYITMTDTTIEEQLAELEHPVAVEAADLEDLQKKADQFEEMNSSLSDLRERTEILDTVDRELVEELANAESPVVLESSHVESLEAEAEMVKKVYAEALAEAYDLFEADELVDRYTIEELRQKYEAHVGEPEENLTAEPRSGDKTEEELEATVSEAEEQLTDEEQEAADYREQLQSKILADYRK